MTEHPILFTAPMVRAILAGRKTQTRRIVTARNSLIDGSATSVSRWDAMQFDFEQAWVDQGPSPAGNPGPYLHVPSIAHGTVHRIYPRYLNQWDALWVRETFAVRWCDTHASKIGVRYRADDAERVLSRGEWKSGMAMHIDGQWAPSIHMHRCLSRITLRINGVRIERLQEIGARDAIAEGIDPISSYQTLWESIHGRGSWDANPWVCAITFERLS